MEIEKILPVAQEVLELLKPFCERIEIAGSVRRKKPECKDIDLVLIPKSWDIGLLESGLPSVLNQMDFVSGLFTEPYSGLGELPNKNIQRLLPSGILLDIYLATPLNYGYILALRTGSEIFNRRVLIQDMVKRGSHLVKKEYRIQDGHITRRGEVVAVPEECDAFRLLEIPFVEPEHRK